MNWREAIREGFPSPRDQEPAELRQDIADELADHLACALRHELRRTDDESEARRRVLERFGDPKRLAYRLWFDAMRETIMKDRVLLAGIVVMIITCLATCAVAWMAVQESRSVNLAILTRLESLAGATGSPSEAKLPLDWARLTVRLVEESEQGAPVVGTTVKLDGRPFSDTRTKLKATSDDDGLVTFGPIHPGQYTLYFATESGLSLGQGIVLYPAQEHEETVVYPTTTTPHADVMFSFDLPPDLEEEPFLLRCKVRIRPPAVEVSGRQWYNNFHSKMMHYVLLTSNGEVLSDTSDGPGRSTIEMPELPDQPDARLAWMAGYARLEWIEGLVPSGKADNGASLTFSSCGKESFREVDTPRMRIRPDVLNTWSISLPATLLNRLRKRMATASQPTATQPSARTGTQ